MYFFFCDSAGFAVTGHVDGAGKSHVFVSEVDPLGLSSRDGKTENGFRFYVEGDAAFRTVWGFEGVQQGALEALLSGCHLCSATPAEWEKPCLCLGFKFFLERFNKL